MLVLGRPTGTSKIGPTGQPFNGELSFMMAAFLWSDRFVNKKLRKFNHQRKTF